MTGLDLDRVRVLVGDARDRLQDLPEDHVHTCITSPPYWNLRDYAADGQIGLEDSLEDHVETIVDVFREVRRVLRPDGTLWLNYGDTYNAYNGGSGPSSGLEGPDHPRTTQRPDLPTGHGLESKELKPKDLMGIPWRVALALQRDGWFLRSDIIWSKPNPMPESVKDRPTKAHEYVFLLTPSPRYYYDHVAICEPSSDASGGRQRAALRGDDRYVGEDFDEYQDGRAGRFQGYQPARRNKRTVWEITTQPYPDAHFATFPPELIRPCVRAGTSEKGACSACGAPYTRVTDEDRSFESGSGQAGNLPEGKHGPDLQGGGETLDVRRGPVVTTTTIGWEPTCDCQAGDTVPCTVLDPFIGSGTTARVALEEGRDCVGIDIQDDYVDLVKDRVGGLARTPRLDAFAERNRGEPS